LPQHLHAAFCYARGMLVSPQHWVPANQVEYGGSDSILPAVGCNRLFCARCNSPVRCIGGRVTVDATAIKTADIYAASEAELHYSLGIDASVNLYVCRCRGHAERATAVIAAADDFRPLNLPWACAGHTPVSWPLDLGGLCIDAPIVADALVADPLCARVPVRVHPAIATLAGFQAVRLARLPAAADYARLAAQVASMLVHADPGVSRGGLGFYRLMPDAFGFQRLLELRHRRAIWSRRDPVDQRPHAAPHPEVGDRRDRTPTRQGLSRQRLSAKRGRF